MKLKLGHIKGVLKNANSCRLIFSYSFPRQTHFILNHFITMWSNAGTLQWGHWSLSCRYMTWNNYTGGNRTMVAAVTIVSMAAAKKAQQIVFALYHSYNRTILLGFIWILDFHFKIVLVLRHVIWFPYDVIMAKEKCGLDDGCTILILSADDGCTRWWRWLHYFGRVIFDTHSWSPADKYAYRQYNCCQVWYV